MSTVASSTEQRLAAAARARDCTLLDAPVSGGDVGAKAGTLSIMVGGDAAALARVRPILERMGQRITHCGGVGMGQVAKLCNQILVSTNLLAVCEALLFARQQGLDERVMIEAVQHGAAGSWQLANLGPRIVAGDFAPGFRVDLLQKDLRLVLQSAREKLTPLLGTAQVQQLFTLAQAQGEGQAGTQVLGRVLARLGSVDSAAR
jgi:3-hydroxyisobutyrate dehydrogenase